MVTLHRYQVAPALPPALEPLLRLARNVRWTWHRPARQLFADVDPGLFEAVSENPLALLARIPSERLDALARDASFVSRVEEQIRSLDAYLGGRGWFEATYGADAMRSTIAYFSMEFGLHECLPVYSGGLGVLAGDHLKSASDLGVPLVGVGIAFSLGYFRQSLDATGWQTERYPRTDWHELPVSPVLGDDGRHVTVSVALPEPGQRADGGGVKTREIVLRAFRVDVGRVPLFLLDANLPDNAAEDRALTNTLYGGDRAHRIRQEILLGVGGLRMLAAIGRSPSVCHMNEGHSAFLALERVRQLMAETGAPFEVAAEAAAAGNIFTTHTPVPAGNDAFAHDLIAPYLEVLGRGLGKTAEEVARIGRVVPDDATAEFSMPVLAIRMADRYNGVSMLHGREARAMWRVLWNGLPVDEVPIGSITNGVHLTTWVGPDVAALLDRYVGPRWHDDGCDPDAWAKIEDVPDEELWQTRQHGRAKLVEWLGQRLGGASRERVALDPHALTIGFARRFATYKRGALLLRDPERLERILSRADRPVQLVFSGKAHPQDWGGKELIRAIVRAAASPAFRGKITFVEDYDINVARRLVSGVDVWLNTPRRPLEASGTSGMKAALNGVLHASILDGWWCEAYAGDNGFAIGAGEEYDDPEHGDRVEAETLYRLLEEQIIPAFYERDERALPRGWIRRMKRSIASVGPVFNTARMVREYATTAYVPAAERRRALTGDALAGARALATWRSKIAAAWPSVRVEAVADRPRGALVPGAEILVAADVALGALGPDDVRVELYHGKVGGGHEITAGEVVPMIHAAELGPGRHRFEGVLRAGPPGEHAFAVRVVPHHEALAGRHATRLVAWH